MRWPAGLHTSAWDADKAGASLDGLHVSLVNSLTCTPQIVWLMQQPSALLLQRYSVDQAAESVSLLSVI